jgi:hypothetical protein
MNKSTAIFLVRKDVRCIAVSYEPIIQSSGKKIPTDIKSFKTFDAAIKVGDLVLVPTDTRWGFAVGKVTEIDLHVDFDSPQEMRWIVQKVDASVYDQIVENERSMMDAVADADREARRKELAAKMFAHNPDLANNPLFISGDATAPASGFEPDQRGGAQT